ncbi:MAG: ornithine cyclodeaminase family protein [Planctomycetes bacterium]|nr:ornithine cyclodeaminase family protein [Planctomycetota bacterium]
MLILDAAEVRQALPMRSAVEGMKRAFAALSEGRAVVPLRAHLPVEPHQGISLVMSAFVQDAQGEALTVKVVSLFDGNAALGLPRIQAAVLVLEPGTGRPVALLEGAALTAIRTGAASGAATDLLARSDCATAAVFGAGVQARTQLEAVCTVRPIETVWIHDPVPGRAEELAAELAGRDPIPPDVRAAADARQAVADADVVCTATTSRVPVFAHADLKQGVHVNAVGSYQPDVREIPPETVIGSRVVVDSREAALCEAGDLIQPIRRGLIDQEHIHAELGELVLGRRPGRGGPEEITLFKAVGVAVQDALAARLALDCAEQLGLGQRVRW